MNSKPLRVLFISTQPFLQWRGSSLRVKFNLLALESLGMRVDLLTMPFGEDDPDVRSAIFRVRRIPGISGIPIGPSAPKLLLDLLILFKASTLALKNRYDVIHATEEGGVIAWLVSRMSGARCIYEKHSDPASYAKRGVMSVLMKAYAAVERFTARHADAVICTGRGLERQAREYAPDTPVFRIQDIPSSLVEPDSSEVGRVRETLGDADDVVVTYVGSFAAYQGVDLVFDAIPRVLARAPQARFLIVGGSDGEIARYRSALGRSSERVIFAGSIAPDRLPAFLRASDILLAPRRQGVNTPLKVLDYFKAGAAIVATDTEANRLILDDECALLAPFDPDAFADMVVQLVSDPKRRATLAARGRRLFETRYNFDVFTAQLADVYGRLSPRRAPSEQR